ncbi:uncharacterized protein LOC134283222 [Saccostrea cucullata]|uniref:uncharacterized protein LOC134283222 n=1 Tax=Saccostrea cuccullata TaxID=36930 RepID=UPI002ED65B07
MTDGIQFKNKRNRGKNFDSSEIQLLADLVERNVDIINSKLTNSVTNEKKKKVWDNITEQINALGVSCRTTKEIKTKWTNMHQTAKKEFSNNKLSQRRTGGGPCAKPLSTVSEKIIDIYKDSPTFTGLSGFETQAPDEGNIEIPVLGSPQTVSMLTELLIPTASNQLNEGELNECPDLHVAQNLVTVAAEVHVSATDEPTTTATTNMEPNISKTARTPTDRSQRRRIRPEDVTRMQYEVLVEQKKKIQEQTIYYQLMNKKLRLELDLPNED